MRYLIILSLATLMGACSSLTTAYDYNKDWDFSQYKTYQFSEDDLENEVGEINRNRMLEAIRSEMNAKGLTESETSDLLIRPHVKTIIKSDARTTGGRGQYNWHSANTTTHVYYDQYTEGTMFITLIESEGQSIVWEGTASRKLNEKASPEKKDENIKAAVAKILSKYPPK